MKADSFSGAELARFEAAHRARGLPVTLQGRAVYEAVRKRTDHPAADAVYAAARDRIPRISRMTVYRILEKLVKMELLNKTLHPGAAARYDPVLRRHHHLVCMDCGILLDIEDERLNDVPWPDVRRAGFRIRDCQVHFRGQCAACRRGRAASSPAGARARGRTRASQRNGAGGPPPQGEKR